MTRRLSSVVLLVVLACCAEVPPSAYQTRDTRRNEILTLDGKIMGLRKDLGLQPHPPIFLIQQMHGGPIIAPPPTRPGTACADVCDIADSICRAQENICRITDELGDDDWARAKCDSAKASCIEAKKRCTDCAPPKATRTPP